MADESEDAIKGSAEVPIDLPSRAELAAHIAELEASLQALSNVVSSLSARFLRTVDDLRDEVAVRPTGPDLEQLRRDLVKMRDRIEAVVDEVGYGEALDIAKVPPTILEAAYQGILDDVVARLRKSRGHHDAERHILDSLEQVRLKTSGSELFHWRHHRIEVGMAKALDKNLVSARQVQMTYEELLRHLLEPIHFYTPRNFRALIKIKSQEYAVNTAMNVAKGVSSHDATLEALQGRVARIEEQVTGALRDLQEFAERIGPSLASAASRESVESLGLRLEALERGRARRDAAEAPSEDLAARVLEALREEPRTAAALARVLEVPRDVLQGTLDDLGERNLITSSTKGRSAVYSTKEEQEHA